MIASHRVLLAFFCLFAAFSIPARGEDQLIADFDGADYGAWKLEGTAFGAAPARGTLEGQMDVTGYQGAGLVNSFHGGDAATGRLTSPPFVLTQPYLCFLIGGGAHPGETCINLLIDGTMVRTATGPNSAPGGSEALRWTSWEVSAFAGKEAVIEIVDLHTGGWGHINVDQIMQCDAPRVSTKTITVRAERRYLNFPVKNGAAKSWVHVYQGETLVREFDIELAPADPDFYTVLDLQPFAGAELRIQIDDVEADSRALETIRQADTLLDAEDLYREELRPQMHFSTQRGWINDPNGLVYYGGEYHLFYQHNPFGWNWGNMTWGHAVSTGLLHWNELGDAIHPDHLGAIFSGSAVVDEKNTSGFQSGAEPPIVCFYTAAGDLNPASKGQPFTQCIAYSNDRGRTFTKFEGNPVIGHIAGGNRDPKVIWYAPGQHWVMILFIDGKRLDLFTSTDLKSWTPTGSVEGFYECPELFEISVEGAGESKWVVYGADGGYMAGSFDGKQFTPETKKIRFQHGNCFYASQTWNNLPQEDGRRIQIAWGQIGDASMPFNQMMNFPVELTLHATEDGLRLHANPVREIVTLHGATETLEDVSLEGTRDVVATVDAARIRVVLEPGSAATVGLQVRGVAVTFDTAAQELRCGDKRAPVTLHDGAIMLEVLVDRMSLEIFANQGQIYMPMGVHFEKEAQGVTVFAEGGAATVRSLALAHLKPIW
ncbi:MAG: GH32 C-terminal domain-containing protein [Candidatus Hydrogenedentes bacterium]|nr:GH32 C-terminal domain-containing protein [Candidatus Hydrogenedentota bacterium]